MYSRQLEASLVFTLGYSTRDSSSLALNDQVRGTLAQVERASAGDIVDGFSFGN